MSDETDREAALVELIVRVQPNVEPALDDPELAACLDGSKRASTWAAGQSYSVGAVIMPSVRNGHRYECIAPGTSGDSEPSFPVASGETVSDGETLYWQEAGREFSNIYDPRLAENKACKMRKLKASEYTGADEVRIRDYWEREERRTAPVVIA